MTCRCTDHCSTGLKTNFQALHKGVTQGNVLCNLSDSGAIKLQGKLHKTLP